MRRRRFVQIVAGTVGALGAGGCGLFGPGGAAGNRHLSARPGAPSLSVLPGSEALGLEAGRDGLLIVPDGYDPATRHPLVVLLHGASGSARSLAPLGEAAALRGAVALLPESRAATWDMVLGRFGPDVDFVDRALAYTFDRCAIDPARIALAGHSDGASYALSLGVSNGDLFTHLIAYAPGIRDFDDTRGRPAVFVSHGSLDPVLPVRNSRDEIVPELRGRGYDVTYHEYIGLHNLTEDVALMGLDWFLG